MINIIKTHILLIFKKKYFHNILFFITISGLVYVDWLTKNIINSKLKYSYQIFGEILQLKLVYNSGVAFSLPIKGIIQLIITYVILIFLIYQYFFKEKNKNWLSFIGYAFIISGAIGNLIERQLFGKVTDFIDLKYFAIFNFADILVTVGVGFLFFYYYKNGRKQ